MHKTLPKEKLAKELSAVRPQIQILDRYKQRNKQKSTRYSSPIKPQLNGSRGPQSLSPTNEWKQQRRKSIECKKQTFSSAMMVNQSVDFKEQRLPPCMLSLTQKRLWKPMLRGGRYSIHKVIGQGSYGHVVKAYCHQSQQTVAIKRISSFTSGEYPTLQVLREIQLMKELNKQQDGTKYVPIVHDIIVEEEAQLSGKDPNLTVFVVMEYFKTDLKNLIETGMRELDPKKILKIMYDCLCALRFLHACNVVHRDIKPGNIFLTHDMQVKIGDFGISRSLPENLQGKGSCNSQRVRNYIRHSGDKYDRDFKNEETKEKFIKKIEGIVECLVLKSRSLSDHVGSRWYRAPEIILLQRQYDQAQDMWSMGCIFFELLQMIYPAQSIAKSGLIDPVLFRGDNCFPLTGNNEDGDLSKNDQMRKIVRHMPQLGKLDFSFIDNQDSREYMSLLQSIEKPVEPNHYMHRLAELPVHLEQLLSNMLQFNPYMRWSARECIDMEIFNDFDSTQASTIFSTADCSQRPKSPNKNKHAQGITQVIQSDKILLEVDRQGAYNYSPCAKLQSNTADGGTPKNAFTKADYIKMIIKESTQLKKNSVFQS